MGGLSDEREYAPSPDDRLPQRDQGHRIVRAEDVDDVVPTRNDEMDDERALPGRLDVQRRRRTGRLHKFAGLREHLPERKQRRSEVANRHPPLGNRIALVSQVKSSLGHQNDLRRCPRYGPTFGLLVNVEPEPLPEGLSVRPPRVEDAL